MKFQELNNWALSTFNKDNTSLIESGVDPKKLSKVKNILKEGISVRCKLIISNTEKNNKYITEVEEFIKLLTSYGLNPIKDIEKANKQEPVKPEPIKPEPVNATTTS